MSRSAEDLFTSRKGLDEICSVPDKIISVYSLEKHVWADSNSKAARKARQPELETVKEFQIDPVRPFLTDVLRNIAAPYKPERRDAPIGQGYWIQAEFGSGKSHLLCLLAALALGRKPAWDIIQEKETKAGRGKRESINRFWEEGLEAKSSNGKKGIFVVVKTLVGAGGGTIGLSDTGMRLSEYILDAAKDQLQLELGKNLSLYPTELLADRFLSEDLDRYRGELRKFLRDPKFFAEDEFEDVNDFIRDIQQNKSPEYKRSCGNKLWRFYTEYLKVQPHIAAETEDILKNLVEVILNEGYSGVLLVLDEVSLFMKNRDDNQRTEDEKTLVVLSNRLAKVHNLPIWTVCSAQQAIESKMGVKNIIAEDRLKLVKLLDNDKDYYDIVLARVREVRDPGAVGNYYVHYKRGFTWPNSIGEQEFRHFFPFHKPALEVLRDVTYELTTTRSAIHFMHQTLKHQIKEKGRELIRLWELFDEAVRYEEDPSGVHAGLVAIKTKRETEYRAYEACKRQIDGMTKGALKVYRDRAIKVIQTLFLYYVARTRQQGLSPEEIANSVLIERDAQATPEENVQHYESLADSLKKELPQIAQTFDEDNRPRYRFDPVVTGVDPRTEFQKARDEAETDEVMVNEAWEHLLALGEWPVKTRQMTIDLSNGIRSIFRDVAPFTGPWEDHGASHRADQTLEINWRGRQTAGLIGMRDLGRMVSEKSPLPAIDTDQTDRDFAVFVGIRPTSQQVVSKLLERRKDPRVIFWTPGDLTHEEQDKLLNFAAYRKLLNNWQGKESEDAVAVVNWVASTLQSELGRIAKIVPSSYGRGRMDALHNSQMDFHVAGELSSILTPLVGRVLTDAYESRDIKFDAPFIFRKEEAVKVINGIVKTGRIPKGAKPNQNISAAQNFGIGLRIVRKGAERELDLSDNPHVRDMWNFIETKLTEDGQTMKVETLYKNFMGVGGPKDYGLSRRMVQLFLLCLGQQGKVRVGVSPKSGLSYALIDYANIAQVDFTAKVLDSLTDVQKLAKPENWEVLRPYAEKLLNEVIPSTHDDAIISTYRTRLRELFAKEKEEAPRIQTRTSTLFEDLKTANPYATELDQAVKLFSTDIETGNDINALLHALKEALGYQAFDSGAFLQAEVDDLANRLTNYRDLQRFIEFEPEIRVILTYCNHNLPDLPDLAQVRNTQRSLREKLDSPKTYIDSDVELKTELVGKIPPEPGESGTLGALVGAYTTVYGALHDSALDSTERNRRQIQNLLEGDGLKVLRILEKIAALRPPVSDGLQNELTQLAGGIFTCASPSRNSIEEQVRRGPVHECGLSFQNVSEHLKDAETAANKATALVDMAFSRKMEVFMNQTVRQRLQQGESDPVISGILGCQDGLELRAHLTKAVLRDPSVVDTINRYLKRISVRRVRIADFKPTLGTIEKDQIATVAREFRAYLEEKLSSIEGGEDTLPMLQLE
jgi:hypothetical protein